MPFKTAQSVLKKILPAEAYNITYRLAFRGYNIWQSTSEDLYFLSASVWSSVSRNKRQQQKIRMIQKIRPFTLVGQTGLLATYDIVSKVEDEELDGCIVECGVARGGCSALMALIAEESGHDRKSWLFDSFEGLPVGTAEDEYADIEAIRPEGPSASVLAPGYCLGTYEEVEDLLFRQLGLQRQKITLIKGWFQDTLPKQRELVGPIAVLRIDADWYESVRCCLEELYDNVVTGGFIIIDDYNMAIGCRKAVDEFRAANGVRTELRFDKRGGCSFMKP